MGWGQVGSEGKFAQTRGPGEVELGEGGDEQIER